MALITVEETDKFTTWITKNNQLALEVQGDLDNLDVSANSLVDATNNSKTLIDSYLFNVIEDDSPQLGGNLNLYSNDVVGTGNIDITGSFSTALNTSVTTTTADMSDVSGKIATTAFVDQKVPLILSNISFTGDMGGTTNNTTITSNVVSNNELNVSAGNIGQVLKTDGAGNLGWIHLSITGDVLGTTYGNDINSNTVNSRELNVFGGDVGKCLGTNGSNSLTFRAAYSEETVTATANQNSINYSYTPGCLSVFVNGIKMIIGVDIVAGNGTTVTFNNNLTAGHHVTFQKFGLT